MHRLYTPHDLNFRFTTVTLGEGYIAEPEAEQNNTYTASKKS
jgi:hypothetical protein